MKISNDTRKKDLYREKYYELTQASVPLLTDDLELQVKIEDYVIRAYLRGYEDAKRNLNYKIAQLKYRNKVQKERILGLEQIVKRKKRKK